MISDYLYTIDYGVWVLVRTYYLIKFPFLRTNFESVFREEAYEI